MSKRNQSGANEEQRSEPCTASVPGACEAIEKLKAGEELSQADSDALDAEFAEEVIGEMLDTGEPEPMLEALSSGNVPEPHFAPGVVDSDGNPRGPQA